MQKLLNKKETRNLKSLNKLLSPYGETIQGTTYVKEGKYGFIPKTIGLPAKQSKWLN